MSKKIKILVTGANGQLGQCFRKLADSDWDFEFFFKDSSELNITDQDSVSDFFYEIKPDYCINAAAYTAVDLAEKEQEKAFLINADGVKNLAEACQEFGTTLIHISTDYVFDGDTNIPYSEENFTNPIGVYGESKLRGEDFALENCKKTVVIRTSWLYSEFNKNFVKTMMNLFQSKLELGIVNDQFGQPTNANDLAETVLEIIKSNRKEYGVFHFSNYPETTWFNFAEKIAEFTSTKVKLNPITTQQYPTPAKRPVRSTMSLDKIEKFYKIELKYWENSLEECIDILKSEK